MSILSHLSQNRSGSISRKFAAFPVYLKMKGKIRKYLLDFASKNNLNQRKMNWEYSYNQGQPLRAWRTGKQLFCRVIWIWLGKKMLIIRITGRNDPIIPVMKDGWVMAIGTTLGADDGIGIAAQMAILTDKKI